MARAAGLERTLTEPLLLDKVLRMSLHSGFSVPEKARLARRDCNRSGRMHGLPELRHTRLLVEGSFLQAEPLPLQCWQVIHGTLHSQSHLVQVQACLHEGQDSEEALRNTYKSLLLTSMRA